MSMTIKDLAAVAERIKRETAPPPPPYEFTRDERWNAILQGLPRTCLLWRRFLQFEQARTAYEAEQAKKDRWMGERRTLGHLLANTDPDTEPGATFGANYWRSQQLEYAITRQTEQLAALKMKAERATEAWGQLWAEYARMRNQHAQRAC